MSARRGAALAGALWLAAAASLGAQAAQPPEAAPPTLDRVDSLVVEGRTEDARAVLTAWLEAGAAPRPGGSRSAARASTSARPASRADAQRAIWLRALLTVDPTQAAIDFQRLVVEYPGGPFSDRALLRLAQAAQAQGQTARARELLASVLRDYPGSPLRLEVGALMEKLPPAAPSAVASAPPNAVPSEPTAAATATAAAAPGEPTAAPRAGTPTAGTPTAAPARVEPAATPEPRSTAATAASEPPAAALPPPGRSTEAPAEGRWTVQVGAFASPERAAGLRDELARSGLPARVVLVPGSRLIRVRTGRYVTQAEADRARDGLTGRGLDATVAGDADREEAAP